MSHEVSQFSNEQNSIALNSSAPTLTLQKKIDLLTLGLLQEKNKVAKLLVLLNNAIENMDSPAVSCQGEWQTGMFCGLEDRGITDRYDACMYGYEHALERVREWVLGEFEAAIAEAEE